MSQVIANFNSTSSNSVFFIKNSIYIYYIKALFQLIIFVHQIEVLSNNYMTVNSPVTPKQKQNERTVLK